MSVRKRTNRTGQIVWYYQYDGPGSTREMRDRISASGFSTKRKAEDAEAIRRIEEQRKQELPKGVSLHTLRHSHGSHLLAAGMSLPVVSERLGHSSVRITAEVYSHAIRGQDDEAARRWEAFQGQNTQEKQEGLVQ